MFVYEWKVGPIGKRDGAINLSFFCLQWIAGLRQTPHFRVSTIPEMFFKDVIQQSPSDIYGTILSVKQ